LFYRKNKTISKKTYAPSTEYKPIKATQVRIAAKRFYVLLKDGRELGIPYDWYCRLAEAATEQLETLPVLYPVFIYPQNKA
jgi:hypothetical protein